VGVSSLVAGYYLSELLSRYRRHCPEVQVLVTEETPRFLEHLLINGELDVAIMVSNALGEPQALMAETLTRSANRVWLASNHPLAARDEVSLVECAECAQIVLEADRIDDLMRSVWSRHQLKPKVMLKTSSLEAVRSLVGAGLGLAVLPDFLYRPWTLDAEHVDVRPLRDELPTVDVGLVWLAGVAVLFSVVGAFYYLRVVKVMFFDEPGPEAAAVTTSGAFRFLLSLNAVAVLALGLFNGALLDAINRALP